MQENLKKKCGITAKRKEYGYFFSGKCHCGKTLTVEISSNCEIEPDFMLIAEGNGFIFNEDDCLECINCRDARLFDQKLMRHQKSGDFKNDDNGIQDVYDS